MMNSVKKWLAALFLEEETIILLLLIFGSLVLLIMLSNVIAPVVISLVLAFLMSSIVNRMTQLGIPNWLSLSSVFLVFIGGFFGIFLIVLPLLWKQMANFINELPGMISLWQHTLAKLPEQYPSFITEVQLEDWLNIARAELTRAGQRILSVSIANIPTLITLLVYVILVPILTFFFLQDRRTIIQWLTRFLPTKRPILSQVGHEMHAQLGNYVRGKITEIIVVGVVSYLTFITLGLNYAALLGLFVGLSVLIPYIGAIVVTVPIVMVGLLQWGLDAPFYTLLIAYFIIQILDGNVLVPWLFSEAVNLHPVAIILAILVFGDWWGFWGVFFAIPLATFIKAVINAWPCSNIKTPLGNE